MKTPVTLLAVLLCGGTAFASDNLFPEGDFESKVEFSNETLQASKNFAAADEGTLYVEPGDYKNKQGVEVGIKSEQGSKFLRYEIAGKGGFTGILRTYIPLKLPKPTPREVTISLRWRLKDFEPAAEGPEWASAQIEPAFVLANGTVKIVSGVFRLKESNGNWQEVEKTIDVPRGATHIVLQPGLYLGSGTLDIDDIKVIAD